ncbi:MAG: ABC transporter permease [Candidatus Thermoplasmatota archaeon]|nr:ABC transporter permease [Candidatus Thermoplasmatota archaeon]
MTSSNSSFVRGIRSRYKQSLKMLYFLTRSPLSTAGLVITIFYVLLAIFGPIIVGGNPEFMREVLYYNGQYIYNTPLPPQPAFPFGTTYGGFDIFNGVVKGARIDLEVSALVVFSGALIGSVLGAIAGYVGGTVSDVIMRITDIFLSIPFIVLAVVLLLVLGKTLTSMVEALVIVWWPFYTRLVRGQVLTAREHKYVEASVAAGASPFRTVLRHILPNSIYPIYVQVSLDFGNVILTLASLDFLGFGFAGQNLAEWGNIIGLATAGGGGVETITSYWWTILIPGLVLLILVVSLNILGDGIRDVTDPRSRM